MNSFKFFLRTMQRSLCNWCLSYEPNREIGADFIAKTLIGVHFNAKYYQNQLRPPIYWGIFYDC